MSHVLLPRLFARACVALTLAGASACTESDKSASDPPPAPVAEPTAEPTSLPDPTAADMKAGLDLLYTEKNAQAAVPIFQRVLAGNPDHYGATYQLAAALQAAGQPDESRPLWQKMLGMAEAQGDKQSAHAARAALAKLPPPDPHAAAMKSAMGLLYDQNKPAEAAAEFRNVLAAKADHYGATYQLAVALDKLGKRAEAKAFWEKVQKMAIQYNDDATAKTAYARLASAKK